MDSKCTSKEFMGYKDPYSGEPLTVRLHVLPGGKVRYRIEGAHDVTAPRATFEEALSLWSRIDGVAGLRSPSKGFVCAYTGKLMSPVRTPGSARFRGGFCPLAFMERGDVLKVLAHLSGREAPQAEPEARIEAVREAPPAPCFHEEEPSDEALRRAGDALGKSRDAMESSGVAPAKRTMVTPGRKLRR